MDPKRQVDEQSTARRALLLNLPYANTAEGGPKQLFPDTMPVADMYRLRTVPLLVDKGFIRFGITTTTSQQTLADLKSRFSDDRIEFNLISDPGFNDYMKLYDPPKQVVYKDITLASNTDGDMLKQISQTLLEVRADDMLAYLVKQAFMLKASDIHLETGRSNAQIRFRVDGVLHPIATLPEEKYRQLLSALASSANVSTSAKESQTGHISREYVMADESKVVVNLRVETVQSVYGMDAVMRLFNFKPELLRLDKLGLDEYEYNLMKSVISQPSGMLLIVGPTGSGKTTTLYSVINELKSPERKIITLEDPVEYQIDGITQVPIDSQADKQGFADGLRSVLRLDPDIIMVGEIRDLDTAKTALQAALTGHLVLSTYHASSAAAALTRMIDAIGQNPLFSSSLKLITAQRLVRRLDDATKQAYQADEALANRIRQVFDLLPEDIQKPDLQAITLYKPGTSAENPFGYSGQIAIREFMVMGSEMQKELVRPKEQITADSLEEVARKNGMVTMLQDGVMKALQGKTSIEEVFRVLG